MADWQVRQAEHAIRICFVNFLKRTDWHAAPAARVDPHGQVDPLAVLDLLRRRIRTRPYSRRTETSYADWARRFLEYAANQQGTAQPTVGSSLARDYLTYLAAHRKVSASTQKQATCALLFLFREVLAMPLDDLSDSVRAKRGRHLPVVLSIPETAALLSAMSGTTRLMAALIYGGGLRVSECRELRRKDIDFDQRLIFVRAGKGGKDRSTSLAEACRQPLRGAPL